MSDYKKYGLNEQQYKEMIKHSSNFCYICARPPGKRSLAIDHNHKSGKIRGLLCHECNRFLIGRMGDKSNAVELFKRAAKYLASKKPKRCW